MSDIKHREKDSTGCNLGKRGNNHSSSKETKNSLLLWHRFCGSKSVSFIQNSKSSYQHPFKPRSVLNGSRENEANVAIT